MNTTAETKTYRGRSLEEVLPQVRDELGPDAIVLRRREGLAGGVAGFFQRSYVEVEARGSLADEGALTQTRNDRATAEGLATPGVQALVQQASPFADALKTADRAHQVLAAAAAEVGRRGRRARRRPPASTAPSPLTLPLRCRRPPPRPPTRCSSRPASSSRPPPPRASRPSSSPPA